jgi:hypothetical protein
MDIGSIILDCEDLGYEEKDIVIDVLVSGRTQIPHVPADLYTSIQVIARTLEVMGYYDRLQGIMRAR